MDAALFKAAIEALPNGSDLLAFHVSQVETERNRGIEESRKANAEAQGLRKFKIAVEKLGYVKDGDLEEFMGTLKVAKDKAGEADTAKMTLDQVTAELGKLKTDFGKTQAELNAERQKSTELKVANERKTLKSKLATVLAEKVYGHDFVADSLINAGQVVLGDNESVEFVDGDKRVALDAGLQRLLETRPDIVKNTSRPGAGTTPPQGGPAKKFTPEQLAGMDKDTIRANLSDVKKSLGVTV